MTLYEKIVKEMRSDTEDMNKISMDLAYKYYGCVEEDKELLDDVFMILCGWRLETLIKGEGVGE